MKFSLDLLSHVIVLHSLYCTSTLMYCHSCILPLIYKRPLHPTQDKLPSSGYLVVLFARDNSNIGCSAVQLASTFFSYSFYMD